MPVPHLGPCLLPALPTRRALARSAQVRDKVAAQGNPSSLRPLISLGSQLASPPPPPTHPLQAPPSPQDVPALGARPGSGDGGPLRRPPPPRDARLCRARRCHKQRARGVAGDGAWAGPRAQGRPGRIQRSATVESGPGPGRRPSGPAPPTRLAARAPARPPTAVGELGRWGAAGVGWRAGRRRARSRPGRWTPAPPSTAATGFESVAGRQGAGPQWRPIARCTGGLAWSRERSYEVVTIACNGPQSLLTFVQ